jgi:hypothetical protein
MKRVWIWAALGFLSAGCRAEGIGRVADITVIDRDSGVTLPITEHRGEYWIAGKPGGRYSVAIANRTTGRVMAVTSVDGVNVLSGATAAWDQNGYVFEPAQRYEISGWRKSDAQVAAFVFTAAPNSYAERTGRPANVGVIGVALFRERESLQGAARAAQDSASRRAESTPFTAGLPAASAPKLGTAHGEREYSYVSRTEFERRQQQPDEVIRIRYDSMDNLVAMGILHPQRAHSVLPNPFPGSPDGGYVPDPPG